MTSVAHGRGLSDRDALAYDDAPLQNPTFDRRRLAGKAEEQLLFAQINGTLTVHELGVLTGLEEGVGKVLARLEALDAIILRGSPSAKSATVPRAAQVMAGIAQANEETDLEPEKVKRIDALIGSLAQRNYYQLLGVTRSADKKQLKAAYYELATAYHPDRFFRQRLGGYRSKLETIFQHLTLAHDTLADDAARAAYDASLPESFPPSSLPRSQASAPVSQISPEERERARRRLLATKLRGSISPPPEGGPVSRKR